MELFIDFPTPQADDVLTVEMKKPPVPPKERHSALAAYRKVLQYIHANSLQVGDKLEHHSQLVKKLDICNGTLDVAMKWLVEDGLISRKRREGTTLLSLFPQNSMRKIWRVGIVLPGLESSYFFPLLAHYLHCHLERRGASDRTYILSISAMPAHEVDGRSPEDFSGLKEDIDLGMLHGIITPTRLHAKEIPVCGAAQVAEHCAFGALIDHPRFVAEAVEELCRQGKKKLLIVSAKMGAMDSRIAEVAHEIKASHGDLDIQIHPIHSGIASGFSLCDELLATSSRKRPDGIIFQEDLTAQGFAAHLVHQPDYRPAMAVETNLKIPLAYPVPITKFELDINELAACAVDLLIEKFLNPNKSDRIVLVAPKLKLDPQDSPDAGRLPQFCG